MTATIHPSAPPTVIVVGPDPKMLGGIAGVVAQILALDFHKQYRILCAPATLSPGAGESVFKRLVRHFGQLLVLRRKIRRSGAILVHIHTCSGFSFYRNVLDMLIAQWAGCRVVLHVHGAAFDVFHEQAGVVARRFIAWSLRRANCVVALSDGWRRKLQAMAPGARIAVIENAVGIPTKDAVRQHEGPCRFLMLARMDEWKGVDDLLDACAQLYLEKLSFELTLAGPPGTAGDETVLNQKIRERGLVGAVRYIGPVQGEEKERMLEWADVYVQPSRHEGMPLAMLEALACGLPVVATRVGAVPEVIEDRCTGILVPPGQPDRLASSMAELTANVSLREAMAQAGRDLVRGRFSLSRFRKNLVSLYDSMD